ncbi:MAG: MarR family transcriptional regulator [Candidatus Omnitrophica bacterium]|nr:MarR family transcriptional regulator [Candidatus Omnitrophota bacterium]
MNKKGKIAKEILEIFPAFIKKINQGMTKTGEIPSAQMSAIMILADKNQCTLGRLSKDMGVTAPTATGIVDRLYKSGYVKRIRSQEDRRIVNITLTAKGKKAKKNIHKMATQRWRVISNILSLKDQEMHIRILKKIVKGLDEYYEK